MSHELHQTTVEATVSAIASKATTAGATTSVVSWFLSSEFGFLVGICMAIGGFMVNLYYQRRRDRRETLEHQLRMKELRRDLK